MPKTKPEPKEEVESPFVAEPAPRDWRAEIEAALAEIDQLARQWGNEKFNEGANAAAAVVRKLLG